MEQLKQLEAWGESEEDLGERWKEFERDFDALLKSHHKLKLANHNLKAEWEAMVQRNNDLRRRMEAVIGRIRALERSEEEQGE